MFTLQRDYFGKTNHTRTKYGLLFLYSMAVVDIMHERSFFINIQTSYERLMEEILI